MAANKKIESLTPEQTARMPAIRDEWIAYGLSTEPADRARAEAAVRLMYAAAKRPAPARVVWCGGPLSLAIVDAVLRDKKITASVWDSVCDSVGDSVRASVGASVRDSVGDSVGSSVRAPVWASVGSSVRAPVWASVGSSVGASVRDSVWASVGASVEDSVRASVEDSVRDSVEDSVRDSVGASVRDSVWASVRASVGDSVRDSVEASVWDPVRASVRDSVGASVGDSVGDSVEDSVEDSVRASVGDSVRASVSNFYCCYWLAFYDFFDHVCDLRAEVAPLRGLAELHKSAGYFLPRTNICLVSERPTRLRRDNLGRLHSEDGPAILYPDGWGVHSWHGTTVPPEWIESKEKLDPKTALTWGNIEQRRAAIEIVGWDRVLAELPNRVVNRNRDPEIGTLLSVDLPDAPNSRFLKVRCGTGRSFLLPVPQEMETARQANAWTYGLETKQYRPEIRT